MGVPSTFSVGADQLKVAVPVELAVVLEVVLLTVAVPPAVLAAAPELEPPPPHPPRTNAMIINTAKPSRVASCPLLCMPSLPLYVARNLLSLCTSRNVSSNGDGGEKVCQQIGTLRVGLARQIGGDWQRGCGSFLLRSLSLRKRFKDALISFFWALACLNLTI
jgi:hypothetical protein